MASSHDSDFIALQAALAGEYSLDREIGRGGMGIVYLAREVRLARPVAIKVLPPNLATRSELRDAFLGEAQVAARLNHPNIVPVHAAGERGGFAYIVMAYVEGMTLGERIRTRGPMLPGQAARMLRDVAWALAYAHAAGIVHRDVTAENILLDSGTERAIVMDFGIASAMQTAAVGDDGRVMGNAHYVSPEQAVGEPMDARSDLYSLGVCGFFALTGRLPFDADTPEKIVAQHLTTSALPVCAIATSVPSRLGQAVDKCLAKDPLNRYRTAEAFAEAIDLAFEHAKEIPAALRVWISQGEKEEGPRAITMLFGLLVGGVLSTVNGNPWLLPLSAAGFGGVSVAPIVIRLRRILRDGYRVEDLPVALREHELLRSEELAYERRNSFSVLQPALWIMFAGSMGSLAFLSWVNNSSSIITGAAIGYGKMIAASTAFAILSTVGLAGSFLRTRLAAPIAALRISFWNGRWAARLANVASVGLEAVDRQSLRMPLLTEVALGRATDHLFQALPKAARRELAELPAIVRQLEHDATRLRASVSELDEQLSVFARSDMRPRLGAASHVAGLEQYAEHREETERELRSARSVASQRLAATVAALENIRLDLLRLQMGSTGIESVTASLEAAQRIGAQINEAIAAQDEVERILRDVTPPRMISQETAMPDDDDDADTPVDGVTAARD
jgi:serine/threonine-protein kinase